MPSANFSLGVERKGEEMGRRQEGSCVRGGQGQGAWPPSSAKCGFSSSPCALPASLAPG